MSFLDGLIGGVGSFNPDDLFSIALNPILGKVYFFIKVIVYLAVFLFGSVAFYKFYLQYKIKITVISKIGGGGIEIKHDRAKLTVDKQGKHKLQLFKLRKGRQALTCPVPKAHYKNKSGKADHYFFWLDDNWQIHPTIANQRDKPKESKSILSSLFPSKKDSQPLDGVAILQAIQRPEIEVEREAFLKVLPEERRAWALYEDKRLAEKYKKKDMMEKYLPAGILITAMVFSFLLFFFGFKELGAGMSGLGSQFAQIASSCVGIGG